MSELLNQSLLVTLFGMTITFAALGLVMLSMYLLTRLTAGQPKAVSAKPASQMLPVSCSMNVGRKVVMEACMNPLEMSIAVRGSNMCRIS